MPKQLRVGDWSIDYADMGLSVQNTWVYRVVDLTGYAGKSVLASWVNEDAQSGAGDWEERFADIAVIRADGSVTSFYNGQESFAVGYFGMPGVTNQAFEIEHVADTNPVTTSHYYLDDHLGTSQLELASGGWPVWQGQFTPFGQEIINGATQNAIGAPPYDGSNMHYKFTGKERDSESGLDYFGARYYGSSMGRFMSPDPSGLAFADPENPQGLNLYSYVLNNPLSFIDPDGMECVWDDGSFDSADDKQTGSHSGCSSQGGTYVDPKAFSTLNAGDWVNLLKACG